MNIMIKTSRYWNNNHMMCQFEDKIHVLNNASNLKKLVYLFDKSSGHSSK